MNQNTYAYASYIFIQHLYIVKMKLFDNLPRCQYYDQFYYCGID